MIDSQHIAYRTPRAVIRIEAAEEGVDANIEIISHVHANVVTDQSSKLVPEMIRHELHHKYANGGQITSLQVTVEFNKPEHVISAQFVKWADHELDHPVCVGNGMVANLTKDDKTEQKVRCLGPKRCPMALVGNSPCMIDVRANVLLDNVPVEIRSNSENGYKAMLSGLGYAKARSGGNLASANLELTTWKKSTRGSKYQAFTTFNIDYVGQREDADPVLSEMEAYGEELLKERQSKFDLCASLEQGLELPTMPSFQNRKYRESATNSGESGPDMQALFENYKQTPVPA